MRERVSRSFACLPLFPKKRNINERKKDHVFSIREHTTVCGRLRKNFGEKTNSFRGNIFIDRKKKRKRKNYAIEKKIFSLYVSE